MTKKYAVFVYLSGGKPNRPRLLDQLATMQDDVQVYCVSFKRSEVVTCLKNEILVGADLTESVRPGFFDLLNISLRFSDAPYITVIDSSVEVYDSHFNLPNFVLESYDYYFSMRSFLNEQGDFFSQDDHESIGRFSGYLDYSGVIFNRDYASSLILDHDLITRNRSKGNRNIYKVISTGNGYNSGRIGFSRRMSDCNTSESLVFERNILNIAKFGGQYPWREKT